MQRPGICGTFWFEQRREHAVEERHGLNHRDQVHLFSAISRAPIGSRATLVGVGLRRPVLTELTQVTAVPALTAVVALLGCAFPARTRRRGGDRQYGDAGDGGQDADETAHGLSMFPAEIGVNVPSKTCRRASTALYEVLARRWSTRDPGAMSSGVASIAIARSQKHRTRRRT